MPHREYLHQVPRVAVFIVNGGGDPAAGSWIGLCLSRLRQHTPSSDYDLYLWNNNKGSAVFDAAVAAHAPGAFLFEPEPGEVLWEFHAIPMQRMYEVAARRNYEWIVTLDSDAHPVRDGWLQQLTSATQGKCVLGGVWRDELAVAIEPYVHASCLCVRQDFLQQHGLRFDAVASAPVDGTVDAMSDFTRVALANGLELYPLLRSNQGQFHYLIGGIYGGLIYHHGAGSRRNVLFWGEADSAWRRRFNTFVSQQSASLLMREYDAYMHYLSTGVTTVRSLRWMLLQWIAFGGPTPLRRLYLLGLELLARVLRKAVGAGRALVAHFTSRSTRQP